jgi:hypothetical protein
MAGEARPSPGYYIAIAFLAVGLLAGLSLFLLLATRPHSNDVSVEVTARGVECPVGGRATSCYQYSVSNAGSGPAYATCQLTPADGTRATFDDGTMVKPVNLQEGEIRVLLVSVVADEGTLGPPSMSCPATSI